MARMDRVLKICRDASGIGGEDFLRQLVQPHGAAGLEAEMTSFLGAETYERRRAARLAQRLQAAPP